MAKTIKKSKKYTSKLKAVTKYQMKIDQNKKLIHKKFVLVIKLTIKERPLKKSQTTSPRGTQQVVTTKQQLKLATSEREALKQSQNRPFLKNVTKKFNFHLKNFYTKLLLLKMKTTPGPKNKIFLIQPVNK